MKKFNTVTCENSENGVCTEAVDILGQTVTLETNVIEKLIYFDEGINAN